MLGIVFFSSCREMNESSNKANASFIQYVIAQRFARGAHLTSERDESLLFINYATAW